jgi:hypothetical protein
MRPRRNRPIRDAAIVAALLALLLANLLAIRTDLAALLGETPSEPGIYAGLSEHAGHAGWHCCTDPACLVCTAPHARLAAPDATPVLLLVAPEIPVASLYGEARLPWPQAPPSSAIRAAAHAPRGPPAIV